MITNFKEIICDKWSETKTKLAPYIPPVAKLVSRILGGEISSWATLRKLGNSSIARATIIVPVLGYLLILNGDFMEWVSADKAINCFSYDADNCPNSAMIPMIYTPAWRLVFVYFGLALTGIATLLYGWFCPFSHKKYGDALDYALHVKDFFVAKDSWTSLATTLLDLDTKRAHFYIWFLSEDVKGDHSIRKQMIINESDEVDEAGTTYRVVPSSNATILAALRFQYRITAFERPIVRWAIFLLYFVGIILLTLSTIWGATEVITALIGRELPSSPWCWLRSH